MSSLAYSNRLQVYDTGGSHRASIGLFSNILVEYLV